MQRSITRGVLWAPVAAAGLFLLVMLVNQGEIRAGLNANADFASTPVLAELFAQAPPGTTMVLGDYPWYEAFWLLRVTSWLPAHYFVWQMVPFVLWLATAALAGESARRASGARWAGATTAALVICGGVGMRGTLWSLNTHGPAAFHVALIGAALTLIVAKPKWGRGAVGWGGAVLLGLISAVGATDLLVLALGVAPLLAAGAVLALWRGDVTALRLGAVVAVIAVVGAKLLDALAIDASIGWTHKPLKFVDVAGIFGQLNLLPGVVARMASVSPFGQEITLPGAIALAATVVALIAAFVVMHASVRQLKRTVWSQRFGLSPVAPDAADPDDLEPAPGAVDADAVFVAGLVFWFTVIAMGLLAFVFTTAAFDVFGGRYLVSGWVALGVLMPLLATRLELRWLAGAVATLLCVASTYSLIRDPSPTFESTFPTEGFANEVQKFAEANGAEYGYAAFWDAFPLTWHTRFGIQAYPILGCGDGANCRFYEHYLSSWYQPKPGRSFLVIDPSQPTQPNVDRRYGTPVATKQLGGVVVYVYDGDIARYFLTR